VLGRRHETISSISPPRGAVRDLDRLATAALRETTRKQRQLVEHDVVTSSSRPIPGERG